MKGSGKFWVTAGNKGEGLGQIVFAHGGLEVGEPKRARLGLVRPPMRLKTDG
jgi:hypothetical protein